MITAKEAYELAKPIYNEKCRQELDSILEFIEAGSKEGKMSIVVVMTISTSTACQLSTLGYEVQSIGDSHQISWYKPE